MQTEKQLIENGNTVLFKDRYGILQLVANATLTRTPKLPHYLCTKPLPLASSALTAISELWVNNSITLCDPMWIEPGDYINELCWQARRKEEK